MPTRILTLEVPSLSERTRLDVFLASQLPELSRVRVQQLIREGHVEVSGRTALKPSLRLEGGEAIRVACAERPPLEAKAEPIPLRILYEDEDSVVVDKPAGMVVHPGAGVRSGTLVNALLYHFQVLSSVGGPLRPGIVHRLDKMTSGLLVVAKNDRAHRRLANQFRRRQVEKHYFALLHGRLERASGQVALPVARDRLRRIRMTTRRREGREALTEFRVLERLGRYTLVTANLRTGRTHQIRVHFSALGHPVVGDTLYGAPRLVRLGGESRPTLGRNFLHAARLCFRQPTTGEVITCEAPLPDDLKSFLEEVRRLES